MNKFTQFLPFMQTVFDDPETAWKANRITAGIMQSRPPSKSDLLWNP